MNFPLLPTAIVEKLTDLTPEFLREQGIRLLMLDFDNTIVPYTTNTPTEEMALWLQSMQKTDVRLCVVSNSRKPRVRVFCKEYGLDCITHAKKPFSGGIRRCLAKYAAEPAACALVGVYVIKTVYKISGELKKRLRNPWIRLFAAGSILCSILWLLPVLRGQGYWFIERLFAGDMNGLREHSTFLKALPASEWVVLALLVVIILLKVVAAALTVDGGGDGGIFAPSMFTGAFTGFAFAHLVNLTGVVSLQENNFVALGMCGVFTAVMRAPLTGIFLIAEITHSYTLLVPLMIVSSVAYFFARLFEPDSVYRKALAESNLLVNDRDQTMLRRLQVRFNINRRYRVLHPGDRLARLIEEVEAAPGNPVYPVLDGDGRLLGVVYLERVLKAMINKNEFDFLLIYDFMENPPEILDPEDDLAKAMAAFDLYRVEVLPVCDSHGFFKGFLEKNNIFSKYRRMVKETENF